MIYSWAVGVGWEMSRWVLGRRYWYVEAKVEVFSSWLFLVVVYVWIYEKLYEKMVDLLV